MSQKKMKKTRKLAAKVKVGSPVVQVRRRRAGKTAVRKARNSSKAQAVTTTWTISHPNGTTVTMSETR